ncbi:hypothetical protein TcG_13173 [Trypanosoma cruzi]|nr:hypothetical protein TcG_13173 [Trypanosoma cruzi]
MIRILAVPLFNGRLLHTAMCDAFLPLVCFLLPTRFAGLIAVRPTDCTNGGLEEQAGCRMMCEECFVWAGGTGRYFLFFIFYCRHYVYTETSDRFIVLLGT